MKVNWEKIEWYAWCVVTTGVLLLGMFIALGWILPARGAEKPYRCSLMLRIDDSVLLDCQRGEEKRLILTERVPVGAKLVEIELGKCTQEHEVKSVRVVE